MVAGERRERRVDPDQRIVLLPRVGDRERDEAGAGVEVDGAGVVALTGGPEGEAGAARQRVVKEDFGLETLAALRRVVADLGLDLEPGARELPDDAIAARLSEELGRPISTTDVARLIEHVARHLRPHDVVRPRPEHERRVVEHPRHAERVGDGQRDRVSAVGP